MTKLLEKYGASLKGGVRISFRLLCCLVFSLILTGTNTARAAETDYRSGEYVIKYSSEYLAYLKQLFPELQDKTHELISQALNAEIGVQRLRTLPLADAELVRQTSSLDVEFVLDLIDLGVIEYIEPHFLYSISATPNDPDYSRLWGMHQSNDIDIDAPEAWDITTGSNQVVVGVIDTGINTSHPDLVANLWRNPGEVAGNGIDDDGNGYVDDINGWNGVADNGNPNDDQSHGSHCAGTIGGVGNNGSGVAGVAWNVKLMGLKFLTSTGSGAMADALDVMNYAIKQKELFIAGRGGANITVLSNSWGGGGYSQALMDAIQRANDVGILFVAAAGNDNKNNDLSPTYPAGYAVPNVISVAAVDQNGNRASFSNYGATSVHVAAPGVAIYSSVLGTGYASYQGTSMATPHVSGIAALVQARWPGLPPSFVRSKILDSVTPLSQLQGLMVKPGIVNAFKAVYAADFDVPPTIQPIANQELPAGVGRLSIPVVADDFEKQPITLSATVNSRGVSPVPTATFSGSTLTLETTWGSGTFDVQVTATASGKSVSTSFTVTVRNLPPVVQAIANQSWHPTIGNNLIVPLQASDPDGDAFSLTSQLVMYEDIAYQLETQYGFLESSYQNFAGLNEKYIWSEREYRWYVILPDGGVYLYQVNGNQIDLSRKVGQLTSAYHANLLLLTRAQPRQGGDPLALAIQGSDLVIQLLSGAKVGVPYTIRVTASNVSGSSERLFTVTLRNAAPTLGAIADRTISHLSSSLQVPLPFADGDGDALSGTATLSFPQVTAYQLDQRHNFYVNVGLFHNAYKLNEKWLYSNTGGWFFILPDGTLYDYVENLSYVALTQPVAKLGSDYYANPLLLVDAPAASAPSGVSASVVGSNLVINRGTLTSGTFFVTVTVRDALDSASTSFSVTIRNTPPQLRQPIDQSIGRSAPSVSQSLSGSDADGDVLTYSATVLRPGELAYLLDQRHNFYVNVGLFENGQGRNEKWIYSAANGWFFITPDGTLYDYVENVTPLSLAQPVAKVGTDYYANPLRLIDVPAPTLPAEGTASLSGATVTVTPGSGFSGVMNVRVSVTDGALSDSKFYSVTRVNNAPTLAAIPAQTLGRSLTSVTVPVSAADADGDSLTISAKVLRPREFGYQLDQKYNFYVNVGLFQNAYGRNEKWIYSASGGWFFITPDGVLYDYVENVTPLSLAQPVGQLGTDYYSNPLLLVDAAAPTGSADGTTSVSGTNVTITPISGFSGSLIAEVSVSDGLVSVSRQFSVSKSNTAPTLTVPGNQTMGRSATSITVPISASDPDGDPLTFTGAVLRPGELGYLLDQQYDFYVNVGLFPNAYGRNEKWLYSNAGGWFFITPDGTLYDYVENVSPLALTQPVAQLGAAYHTNPLLLVNAAAPSGTADGSAVFAGSNLTITPASGFSGTLTVRITVSDGLLSKAGMFTVTKSNSAPTLSLPSVGSIPSSGTVYSGTFAAADPDSDPLTVTATVLRPTERAYQLDQRYNFYVNVGLFPNAYGRNEKWLYSNSGGWFFITPDGTLYDYVENVLPIALTQPVAVLDPSYYANPLLLIDVAVPSAVPDGTASVSGSTLTVTPRTGFAGVLSVAVSVSDGLLSVTKYIDITKAAASGSGGSSSSSPSNPTNSSPNGDQNGGGQDTQLLTGLLIPWHSQDGASPVVDLAVQNGGTAVVTLTLFDASAKVVSQRNLSVRGTGSVNVSSLGGFKTNSHGLLKVDFDQSIPLTGNLTYRRTVDAKTKSALLSKLSVSSPSTESVWASIPNVPGVRPKVLLLNPTVLSGQFTITERGGDGAITNQETLTLGAAETKVVTLSGNELSRSVEVSSERSVQAQLSSVTSLIFDIQNFVVGGSQGGSSTLPVSRRGKEQTLMSATNTSVSIQELTLIVRNGKNVVVSTPVIEVAPESTAVLNLSTYLPSGGIGSVVIGEQSAVLVSTTIVVAGAKGQVENAIQVDPGDASSWQSVWANNQKVKQNAAKKKAPKKRRR